jgi:hypothetical protein
MKRRLAVVAGATLAVVGAAYWLLPASQPAQATVRRSARVEVRDVAASPAARGPAPAEKVPMVLTESGWQPQTTRTQPREWVDPVSGAVHREVLDAVPDPAAAAAEELKYRKSRLRLTLADSAAPCWNGGDSREELELSYTLIVEKEVIRTDNVQIRSSRISNPTVERCIIDAVRDLRMSAHKIPDLREEQGLVMSLHDLHDRNQRQAKSRVVQDDPPTSVDRPTAQPPAE